MKFLLTSIYLFFLVNENQTAQVYYALFMYVYMYVCIQYEYFIWYPQNISFITHY